MFTSKLTVALLALPTLVAHAADGSTCKLGPSEKCAIDSLTTYGNDGSVLIYPGGNTRCAFDDYLDDTTTFESRSTYFFQVFPTTKKSKVLIYFQGGGACVDEDTCNFALQCQLGANSLMTTMSRANNSGIMDRGAVDNPFNDWDIVFLSYCTGDLFVGNAYLAPFESDYSQALGNKQCLGQNRGMYLNGYNNTKAVLDWALENYPSPEQVVVGGYSAGSLAAQFWSAKIADMWQVEQKSTKFQVLADSYVDVLPEYKSPSSSIINFFGGCDIDLNFPKSMVAECKASKATVPEMVGALIKQVSKSEWLFINSIADQTQRQYYELVRLGIAGYPFTTLFNASEFYGNMTTILDSYAQLTSLTRFNIEGDHHVWLQSEGYMTVTSMDGAVLGKVLSDWLGMMPSKPTMPSKTIVEAHEVS
ncbi:hypothetical protein DD238_008336 [Peronospora effusa]|uniref:Uncharacterized protein n=1 Tax=Peronospora effusa TaxID=542832 RepID=A0A3M6VFZ6_9STRA|nr:hypothetical protein DD238_008336 [Peronospora effusa]RQM15705.1 hypothetical protein DD237_004057 [Peronospora effusa]